MGFNDKAVAALDKVINTVGTQIRVRYYDVVFDDVYDEGIELLQSGNDVWTSGVIIPVNSLQGSNESTLVQQGRLIDSDRKLYVSGNLLLNGSEYTVDILIGPSGTTPTGELFTTIPIDATTWEAEGQPVYKKQFIRRLTGSLI